MITLSRWFAGEPRGDRLVAFGRERARCAGDRRRDVTGPTARLTPARSPDMEERLRAHAAVADAVLLSLDDVLVPRAWRFVVPLPSNARGKVPRDALRALFAAVAPPEAPEHLSVARSERTLEKRVRIPWDLASLDGHFPGARIVAGVAQLHFAMRALEEPLVEEPALGRDSERPERSFASGRGRLEPRR